MKYIILTISLFAIITLQAQPKIEFKNKTYDYGAIKEEDGIAETVFEFTNTGNEPLIINNVRATCGCTTPKWTREPLPPGQTGNIKVGYNPRNRPGNFSKSVNVYANTQPSVTVLSIKGKVEPRQKTVEELYPRAMGPIRFKSNYVSMGSVVKTKTETKSIEYINTSDTDVTIGISRSHDHITLIFEPETVKPGKKGNINIQYDASKKDAWGNVNDRVYLTINGERQNIYSISVSANLQEDFSSLTEEELENAPVASFDNTVFNFGTIKQGDKVPHQFILTNNGKSDLIIRNVRASCGCTAVKHENIVKPGKSTSIAVEFNSRGKRNRQNKSITITTNDPKNPTTILRVMGNVTSN